VKAQSFFDAWNRFFFAEESPIPLALFRVLYGVMVTATTLLLRPSWMAWYGPHAWISLSTMHIVEPGPRLSLFAVIPQTDFWIHALFWALLLTAFCLTIGLFTRVSTVIVFLCLASIDQRNLFILNGGDTFLRVAGFFLIFAPAGGALSADRLIRIWRGKETVEIRQRRPWAQRMIQFDLAILYFSSFCWKLGGTPWVQGTALYYVYHIDELQRFPLPSWLLRPTMLKLESWFALGLEFSLGVLIWIKELRYYLLAVGLLFHLTLEYSLNVPMFQWDVLSAYVLFFEPSDLERVWRWISPRVGRHLGGPVTVIYDPASQRLARIANLLATLDIFGRLSLVNFRDSQEMRAQINVAGQKTRNQLLVVRESGVSGGRDAFRSIAKALPLLWPAAILLMIQRFLTFGKSANSSAS
jgi:Vitamin K-dependent gamma-carboxylase